MIDRSKHALHVLNHSERLLCLLRRYESVVGPADYHITLPHVFMLDDISSPALALENALSECGFSPDSPFPAGGPFPGYFKELSHINGLCIDIRLSRHAKTKKDRAEVVRSWGTKANGGWGFTPGKDKKLPKMGLYANRLATFAEMLREALQNERILPKTNATAKHIANGHEEYSADDEDVAILRALLKRYPLRLTYDQIEPVTKPRVSLRTIKDRMPRLKKEGLVIQPRGINQGSIITERGKLLLTMIDNIKP